MPTITELPNDASGTVEDELLDFEPQFQPMDYEHYMNTGNLTGNVEEMQEMLNTLNTGNVANSSIPRDVGRDVFDAQIAQEREQYQPTASEKLFAIVKSVIMRGMVIYFLMSFLRRPQPNQQTGVSGEDETVQLEKEVETNLFENGTIDNDL